MAAMSVRVGSRFAVLLGRDADYPAQVAYYLAHELGHVALRHIKVDSAAIVDLADPLEPAGEVDREEEEADRYALELLTGNPTPIIATATRRFTAEQLAQNVLETGPSLRVEPGTLALCFGHNTTQWPKVFAAMKYIYQEPRPVWPEVNGIAAQQLSWAALPDDTAAFIRTVIGDDSV
jgi:hypothetical protein